MSVEWEKFFSPSYDSSGGGLPRKDWHLSQGAENVEKYLEWWSKFLIDSFDAPIDSKNCKILMERYEKIYGKGTVERDKSALNNLKTPEGSALGPRLERASIGVLSKFAYPHLIPVHTSDFDDVLHPKREIGADLILLRPKKSETKNEIIGGEILAAIDVVVEEIGRASEREKRQTCENVNFMKLGTIIKYPVIMQRIEIPASSERKSGIKMVIIPTHEETQIPIFTFACPKNSLENLERNFTPDFRHRSSEEREVFVRFLVAMKRQVDPLYRYVRGPEILTRGPPHTYQRFRERVEEFKRVIDNLSIEYEEVEAYLKRIQEMQRFGR